jgi:hypothetical protein
MSDLARARKEGATVIGSDAGAGGNAANGVGRILRELGAERP